NGDSQVDIQDVDLICAAIQRGTNETEYDLTGDGAVNRNDMNELIVNILGTTFGDANLDGVFDSRDFVLVFQVGQYEDAIVGNSTWADGDWNCDGEFSSADLVLAFQASGFQI
ncbi:MAG: hypothetical protein KDA92_24245, partial [Planctomycetales bacterium]|nr:hypothetical protein [Planctomycetales bacterium]